MKSKKNIIRKFSGLLIDMQLIISFALIIFCTSTCMSQYAPNLLINTDVDQLVYRLASRYSEKVPSYIFFQPLNYRIIKNYLNEIDSSFGSRISSQEKFLIDQFDLRTSPSSGKLKWSSRSKDINVKLHLRLIGDTRFTYEDGAAAEMKGIISPLFCANIGKVSFYSGIDVWTEYQSDAFFPASSYQPFDGVPYNLYGRNTEQSHVRSSDTPRGGLRYESGHFSIETAIDYLKIGPAQYFPLTLSGTAPPINYAKATLDFGVVNYTHVVGLLKAQKDKLKYIYIHRLGSSFWNSRLDLALNEVIITGSTVTEMSSGDSDRVRFEQEREWEWAYMIPLVPFKFVEHYVGDKDNAVLSFDMNLFWPVNFRWYLEFFLDDILSPAKIFSDDWGNKWALTVGAQYFGSLFNRDFSFSAEYSRVEPWVYTHFYGASHQYTHFGQCLGSPLGPNSQAIVLSIQSQIHKYHQVGLGFTSLAKNSSARGGNITDVFQGEDEIEEGEYVDNVEKRFLGPGTKWSFRPFVSWNYNPFGLFNVKANCQIDLGKKRLIEGSLSGGFSF